MNAEAILETGASCFGLAQALWWLGVNQPSVTWCSRAYSLFRPDGETAGAVQCAVWLAITYKANFANFVAANGWLRRADRLLESLEVGPLHGWALLAPAYRLRRPRHCATSHRAGDHQRPDIRRHGSVLMARGRWADAEAELRVGLRITNRACPGLHAKALTRMAVLRIRQGRLEEADQLLSALGEHVQNEADVTLSVAALLLARGDAPAASRYLEPRMDHVVGHRAHLASALDVLVDAYLVAGDTHLAATAVERMATITAPTHDDRLAALLAGAQGRVSMVKGDVTTAIERLERSLRSWSEFEFPYEVARARFDLGRVLVETRPELAIDHARHALQSFESIGAALDADRVAAFLRTRGVAARTGPRGVGTITAREREVLRLLGHGLEVAMTTSTESPESFGIPIETAERYESAFVPAFFAQWAPILCQAAGVTSGQRVLDVACGTGIVARTAANLTAPDGEVVGVDLNEAMLTVARRIRPDLEWHQGDAAALGVRGKGRRTGVDRVAQR